MTRGDQADRQGSEAAEFLRSLARRSSSGPLREWLAKGAPFEEALTWGDRSSGPSLAGIYRVRCLASTGLKPSSDWRTVLEELNGRGEVRLGKVEFGSSFMIVFIEANEDRAVGAIAFSPC